jgi:hypothetical protein
VITRVRERTLAYGILIQPSPVKFAIYLRRGTPFSVTSVLLQSIRNALTLPLQHVTREPNYVCTLKMRRRAPYLRSLCDRQSLTGVTEGFRFRGQDSMLNNVRLEALGVGPFALQRLPMFLSPSSVYGFHSRTRLNVEQRETRSSQSRPIRSPAASNVLIAPKRLRLPFSPPEPAAR